MLPNNDRNIEQVLNQMREQQILLNMMLELQRRTMFNLYGNLSLFQNLYGLQQQFKNRRQEVNVILIQNDSEDDKNGKGKLQTQSGQSGNQSRKISSFDISDRLQKKMEEQTEKKIEKTKFAKTKKAQKKDDDQYIPGAENSFDHALVKGSQSKNLPRIFGKNILLFISNNREKVEKVLLAHGCFEELDQFMTQTAQRCQYMGSIADMRNMWINKHNKFAKIYRILSKVYMRKHCLPNIFNSRIKQIQKHLKYRQKIEKSIDDPQNFTNMKDF